jgi:hypothetical protein
VKLNDPLWRDQTIEASKAEPRWRLWSSRGTPAIAVIAVAMAVALSACSDLMAPGESKSMRIRKRAPSLSEICSNCSAEESDAIAAAIANLQWNSNEKCREAGDMLWLHMFAGGSFEKHDIVDHFYYGATSNGYHDVIKLTDLAFTPGQLANTLSHEESHHWGYSDDAHAPSTENATQFGDSCAGAV